MNSHQLIEDIESGRITYKPGWEITPLPGLVVDPDVPFALEPSDAINDDTDVVTIRCDFWAPNSSPVWSDPRPEVFAKGAFVVVCGRPDDRDGLSWVDPDTDVYRQLLDGFVAIETHEAREFLRVDGHAPFHPHRADGRDLYTHSSLAG